MEKAQANFQPLTPIHFLERAASVYPDHLAVVHGDVRYDYAELYRRCRRLASALRGRGIGRGDTVSILAPNIPAILESHYGVPMASATLNTINTRLDADTIAIREATKTHSVTHLCGAPIVMRMIVEACTAEGRASDSVIEVATAAAPPPAATIGAMESAGFRVTHLYGLTETYGPSVVNAWHREWDEMPLEARAEKKSRQGVRYPVLEDLMVADAETLEPVPRDGETMGEVMFRGNVVMKGYLKNPRATEEAFAGGWFHSGDLGVVHPDGYIELRDRSKDIIISGGENISTIEVEAVLYKHPSVQDAAAVARPDEKWGETPCAFITLKPGAFDVHPDEIIEFCRERLAHFKAPKTVVFGELPKTSTGKVQKYVLRDRARDL